MECVEQCVIILLVQFLRILMTLTYIRYLYYLTVNQFYITRHSRYLR